MPDGENLRVGRREVEEMLHRLRRMSEASVSMEKVVRSFVQFGNELKTISEELKKASSVTEESVRKVSDSTTFATNKLRDAFREIAREGYNLYGRLGFLGSAIEAVGTGVKKLIPGLEEKSSALRKVVDVLEIMGMLYLASYYYSYEEEARVHRVALAYRGYAGAAEAVAKVVREEVMRLREVWGMSAEEAERYIASMAGLGKVNIGSLRFLEDAFLRLSYASGLSVDVLRGLYKDLNYLTDLSGRAGSQIVGMLTNIAAHGKLTGMAIGDFVRDVVDAAKEMSLFGRRGQEDLAGLFEHMKRVLGGGAFGVEGVRQAFGIVTGTVAQLLRDPAMYMWVRGIRTETPYTSIAEDVRSFLLKGGGGFDQEKVFNLFMQFVNRFLQSGTLEALRGFLVGERPTVENIAIVDAIIKNLQILKNMEEKGDVGRRDFERAKRELQEQISRYVKDSIPLVERITRTLDQVLRYWLPGFSNVLTSILMVLSGGFVGILWSLGHLRELLFGGERGRQPLTEIRGLINQAIERGAMGLEEISKGWDILKKELGDIAKTAERGETERKEITIGEFFEKIKKLAEAEAKEVETKAGVPYSMEERYKQMAEDWEKVFGKSYFKDMLKPETSPPVSRGREDHLSFETQPSPLFGGRLRARKEVVPGKEITFTLSVGDIMRVLLGAPSR